MRYLDVGVAAMIGASAIIGMSAFGPSLGDQSSTRSELQRHMGEQLVSFISQPGSIWTIQSSPAEVCGGLAKISNGTVHFYAFLGQDSCGTPPPGYSLAATLVVRFPVSTVVIGAWSDAGA